jgi:hypothetical protein
MDAIMLPDREFPCRIDPVLGYLPTLAHRIASNSYLKCLKWEEETNALHA